MEEEQSYACDHCKGLAQAEIPPKSAKHRQCRPHDCLFCGKWTALQPFKIYFDDSNRLGSLCARRACLDAFEALEDAQERMRSVGLR